MPRQKAKASSGKELKAEEAEELSVELKPEAQAAELDQEASGAEASGAEGLRGSKRKAKTLNAVGGEAEEPPKRKASRAAKAAAAEGPEVKVEDAEELKTEVPKAAGKGRKRAQSVKAEAEDGAEELGAEGPKAKGGKGKKKAPESAEGKAEGESMEVKDLKPKHKPKFSVGQTVWGINRGDLYNAKVLQIRSEFKRGSPIWQYLLHYNKWSKSWDEWKNEDMTYPDTPETHQLVEELKQQNQILRETAKRQAKEALKKTKKQEQDSNVDATPEPEEKAYKVNVPNGLQQRLVDDLDQIEQHKILSLPSDLSIHNILTNWNTSKVAEGKQNPDLVEFVDGLEVVFDKALPLMLLYDFEKVQFRNLLAECQGRRHSEIYGAEHLLRFLAKLPWLLAEIGMDLAMAQKTNHKVNDLLKYMDKNTESIFTSKYEAADLEYTELTQQAK